MRTADLLCRQFSWLALWLAGLLSAQAPALAAEQGQRTPAPPAPRPAAKLPPPVLDTVGDIAFVPLLVPDFAALPLQSKLLAYELSQAAIAGNPIIYDQRGKHFPLIKKVLEELYRHLPKSIPERDRRLFTDYLKKFYVHHGYHDHRSTLKFLPGFTPEQLERACLAARVAGAQFPGVTTPAGLKQLLDSLRRPLFDPSYEPQSVVKHPPRDKDILSASATNFYPGLTLKEVERAFSRPGRERYPLNSTVVRPATPGAAPTEQVWRLGTADGKIPPGRYAEELGGVVAHLSLGLPYAPPQQQEELQQLIAYFRTGEPDAFRRYNILWTQDHAKVDTINGFIETYADPRAQKGEYEALVFMADEPMSRVMRLLADNAQAYEDHAPFSPAYRRAGARPPQGSASAVTVLGFSGGAGPIMMLGLNLPNEQALRQSTGSKSLLLSSVIAAGERATSERLAAEFSCAPGDAALSRGHGAAAARLLVAMHEVLGHGSGKVSPRLEGEPRRHLKEYYSTIEEGRADLMALFSVMDPLTVKLGLLPGEEAQREVYRGYLRTVLSGLRRVPSGDSFESDHDRNRQLIVQYLIRKAGVVKVVERGGKRAYCVADPAEMRKGCGQLLAELMRIKAEGDYGAARELVETYGRTFDPRLRDEVVARARAAKLPSHLAMVSPDLVPVRDGAGKIIDVRVEYPRDFLSQQLGR